MLVKFVQIGTTTMEEVELKIKKRREKTYLITIIRIMLLMMIVAWKIERIFIKN